MNPISASAGREEREDRTVLFSRKRFPITIMFSPRPGVAVKAEQSTVFHRIRPTRAPADNMRQMPGSPRAARAATLAGPAVTDEHAHPQLGQRSTFEPDPACLTHYARSDGHRDTPKRIRRATSSLHRQSCQHISTVSSAAFCFSVRPYRSDHARRTGSAW
jgi:hypothetical protein